MWILADVDYDGLSAVGRDVAKEGALDVDGAAEGAGHATERHHEPVSLDADLASTVAARWRPHDPMVLPQLAGGLVAEPFGHARVIDHVAKEDGHRAVAREYAVGFRGSALAVAVALVAPWSVVVPAELAPDVLAECCQLDRVSIRSSELRERRAADPLGQSVRTTLDVDAPMTAKPRTTIRGEPRTIGTSRNRNSRPPMNEKPRSSTSNPSGTVMSMPPQKAKAVISISGPSISARRRSMSQPPMTATAFVLPLMRQRPLVL